MVIININNRIFMESRKNKSRVRMTVFPRWSNNQKKEGNSTREPVHMITLANITLQWREMTHQSS